MLNFEISHHPPYVAILDAIGVQERLLWNLLAIATFYGLLLYGNHGVIMSSSHFKAFQNLQI